MSAQPVVGIIMGSDSDLPTMKEAAAVCEEFGIAYELRIVSAHRTPHDMAEYGSHAHTRGIKVIIAGAGGAAHLPGMTASYSPLPVIGVPIASKQLRGLDSLLSIVQMPTGVPVATVAIGGGRTQVCLQSKCSQSECPNCFLNSSSSRSAWLQIRVPRTMISKR